MPGKSCFALFLMVLASVLASAQTSEDLAAKYPVVAAYQVRPEILMTAKYAEDGQVCEMTLEKRHYQTAEEIDLGSTIPAKMIDQLTDELVPASERGKPTSRWLDKDSYVAGGVSFTKHDFENVTIEMHGSYSCNQGASSKGHLSCDSGGNEVVVIRWKQRACVAPKQTRNASEKKDANAFTTSMETVDPKTGNLHLTIPLVASTKPKQ